MAGDPYRTAGESDEDRIARLYRNWCGIGLCNTPRDPVERHKLETMYAAAAKAYYAAVRELEIRRRG